MANRSYLDPLENPDLYSQQQSSQDGFEEPERDDDEEPSPSPSIAGRAPLSPIQQTVNGKPLPSVKEFMQKRQLAAAATPKSSGETEDDGEDIENDPLMQRYNADKQKIDEARGKKSESDFLTNLMTGLSPLSRITASPTENPVFKKISEQSAEESKNPERDAEMRRKVIDAIESRNASLANSAAIRGASQDNKDRDFAAKQEKANYANVSRANSLMNDPVSHKEEVKLNSARSAQSLVEGIRSGEITGSKNVAKQLTNMIQSIEMGGPGDAAGRHEAGVDTLYTTLQSALGYATSSPTGVIPSKYLDQMESEIHALGDRAAKNYKSYTDSKIAGSDLSNGDPDASPGQIYQLAKQRQGKLLKGNGYDPETGSPLRKPMSVSDEKAFPKQVRKNGKVATVSNRDQLVEAQNEGWN